MSKYCSECLRLLTTTEEINSGICRWCKDYYQSYGNKQYNYITDRNHKDSWDDSAPYSDEYTDQYDW